MSERSRKGELEATQQTVKFFETLLRASSDGIVITDAMQRIVLVNEAFCTFFGMRWSDVTETGMFDWLMQLDASAPQQWTDLEKRVRLEGTCHGVEFRMTTADSIRHLSVSAAILERVAHEEAGVIISIWRDITERKRAEEALQRAKDELEIRVEARTSELRIVNEQLRGEITERMRAEEQILHLNSVLRAIRNINQLLVREKDRDKLIQGACEELVTTRSYQNAWIALLDESGELVAFAESGCGKEFLPIVEQFRRGELTPCGLKALSQSNLVLTKDPPSTCMDCPNPMTHRDCNAMTIPLKYRDKVYGLWCVSIPRAIATDQDEKGLFKEAAEDIAFALFNIEMEDERKRTKEEKEKMEAQLLAAQKMEAIGNLAGGMAHDFNNLLQAIMGYAEMLGDQFTPDDPRSEDLEEIQKATSRAASLTRQLLAFSRRQPLQPKVTGLNSIIANLKNMLLRLIPEDIDLVTTLEPDLANVEVDPGQIEQIIMNLTVNARDAMPEGGRITIKNENVIIDKNYCEAFSYARPGEFVCLSIEDTGDGMDKETIEHIFEPFFTTKGPGEGSGLGLSVVYGIAKQHEGWINVDSEPGRGTMFKLYLPVSSLAQEEKNKKKISIQTLVGKGERILLVEDEEVVRESVAKVLDKTGHDVITAKTTQEALDIFDREKGDFNLVLSDVVLPDGTGIQLIDQLLSQKPDLRVLLSSGYTDHKAQWPVIQERGFRFIQKPFKRENLLQAVREALESK